MLEIDKKQGEKLKGHYSGIARSCKVSPDYVKKILNGDRNQKTPRAQEVVRKSIAILEILES